MTVTHNRALSRYEMQTEQGVAVALYRQRGDRRIFTHTEVPPADRGRGLAARLVKEALGDSRRAGFAVEPACSYVAAYMRRHPERRG